MSNIAVLNLNSDVYSKSLFCENIKISQIANSKYLQKDSNGDIVGVDGPSANNIVNSQIDANANIDRSKIATGTANYFLLNDANGLISETNKLYLDGASLRSTMNGNYFSGEFAVNGDVYFGTNYEKVIKIVSTLNTSDATPTTIKSEYMLPNMLYLVNFVISLKSNDDSGFISGCFKVKQNAADTQPVISSIFNKLSILDSSLNTCDVVLNNSTNNTFKINVIGYEDNVSWKAEINYFRH